MSWKIGLPVALALLAPLPRSAVSPPAVTAPPPIMPPPAVTPMARSVEPLETWSSGRDARDLAADARFVWVATGGGLDRYAHDGSDRRRFGTADGLDTLDVRSVVIEGGGVVAQTGTSRCAMTDDHFVCRPAKTPPPKVGSGGTFHGRAIAARLRVGTDGWIATRGAGTFFLPHDEEKRAIAVIATANDPSSFVHAGAVFGGELWLGTFDDGLYRVPLDAAGNPKRPLATNAKRVASPARLVNRLTATSGQDAALYVASSEGLFVTRDGERFSRVEAIAAHAMTGLAVSRDQLWATSTEALYRLAPSGRGKVEASFVRPGGTRSIQAVAVDDEGTAWLATEDRGIVRVDATGAIRTYDRLSGLPSSWFVGVETDGRGGVIATTLRHGTVRIAADGRWEVVAWAPNAWGLGVRREGDRVCVTTQGGATCATSDADPTGLASLPDPRVHLALPVGPMLVVGTEAGTALYSL